MKSESQLASWPGRWLAALLLPLVVLLAPADAAAGDAKRTLVVLGDSLSAAYGMDLEQGWVALLAERLRERGHDDWQVVNASVSGDTTAGGVTRLPALLAEHEPDLVVVELGGNDGLRGIGFGTTEGNLHTIVEQAQAAGAKVLLLGMRMPPNFGEAFNRRFVQIFHDVAERHEVALVPFLMDGVGGVEELMQDDGIHPTASAQLRMLDNVWPLLEPML